MRKRFTATTLRRALRVTLLLAACDGGAGSLPDAADAADGGPASMEEVRDARTAIEHFPTTPLCVGEVAYPPVSGDGICSLQVPVADASSLDFAKMNLILRVGGARVVVFAQIADAASCARLQAWHFDDPENPAALVLCPEACSLAGSDPDSQVELVTGCDTRCAETGSICSSAAP